MNVLIDTNVIIDTFSQREPFNEYSDGIFKLLAENKIKGYITTSGITDVYYLLCKKYGYVESKIKIGTLLELLNIAEVSEADCFAALNSAVRDFEDALIFACFERIGLDLIISRDVEFLKSKSVVSPDKFLAGNK